MYPSPSRLLCPSLRPLASVLALASPHIQSPLRVHPSSSGTNTASLRRATRREARHRLATPETAQAGKGSNLVVFGAEVETSVQS